MRSSGSARAPPPPCRRAPALRAQVQKGVSKLIYGLMSRRGAEPASAFINYGYAALEQDGTAPDGRDPDRFGTALYDRVASGAPAGGSRRARGRLRARRRRRLRLRAPPAALAHGARPRAQRDRARRREHARPGLRFVQGDAEALPFGDASFDAVLNVESAHWYPDVARFLAEVFRVLRPGGFLLLADVRHIDLSAERTTRSCHGRTCAGSWPSSRPRPSSMVEDEDITANVRRALELDSPRRRELIETGVPAAPAQAGAGLRGRRRDAAV